MERSQPFTNSDMLGPLLRSAREAAGWSLEQMASATKFGKTTLSYYERGQRAVTVDVMAAYENVLGMPLRLGAVESLEWIGRGDVDRRSFLRGAAYVAGISALGLTDDDVVRIAAHTDGRVAGENTVAALRRMVEAFVAADETFGGAVGRTAVAEFLATDVATILKGRFASQEVRAAAFSTAAEAAYLAGWKANDAAMDGLSQRYYLSALRLAQEAGDVGQQAFVLRALAIQGCDVGQRTFSVQLAQAALDRVRHAPVGPDTEALFHIALARCQAETGENAAAARTIAATPALHADLTEEQPRWAAQWCPHKATLLRQTAKTFTILEQPAESVSLLREVTGIWDPSAKPRIWALSMADLGHAHWSMGDHAAATDAWDAALPTLATVASDRTDKAAAKIHRTLAAA